MKASAGRKLFFCLMKHVIFLHGFCETSEMWNTIIPNLNDKAFTFHGIDLPGFGKNEQTVDSIAAMSDFVFQFMYELDIKTAIIVGHSMGGYVALEMAAIHPERIEAIGLIHSHAASDADEKKDNRRKLIDFVSRNGGSGFLKEFSKQLLSPIASNKDLQNTAYQLVKDTSDLAILSATEAMINRNDHTSTLQNFNKPVLWIIGALDTFVSTEEVLKQAKICPQAQVEVMNDVGHLCMYEDPHKTVSILDGFLHKLA